MVADNETGVKKTQDVESIRSHMKGSWVQFTSLVGEKRVELNELYLLQNVLEGRCVEAEIWLSEMSVILEEEDVVDTVNVKRRFERHLRLQEEIEEFNKELEDIEHSVVDYKNSAKLQWKEVFAKIELLREMYLAVCIIEKGNRDKLENLVENITYIRDLKDIDRWLDEHAKHATSTNTGEDLDQNEELMREFHKFKEDFEKIRERLAFVVKYSSSASHKGIIDSLNIRFDELDKATSMREKSLKAAAVLHQFHADGFDILLWVREKENIIDETDVGDNLEASSKFLKTIEKLAPDMKMIDEKVEKLKEFYEEIRKNYPEQSELSSEKLEDIKILWPVISHKYNARNELLVTTVERFQCLAQLNEIHSDVAEIREAAELERNGKNSVDYQNDLLDLTMYQQKNLHIKNDLEEHLFIPPHIKEEVQKPIESLKQEIDKNEYLITKKLRQIDVQNNMAALVKNVEYVKQWIKLEDKQNPVDVAKAFGRTKEATLFDLQEVRDDLDNITQKENALVVVSDKSKELREEGSDVIQSEEFEEFYDILDDVESDLRKLKTKKTGIEGGLEVVVGYFDLLEEQMSNEIWIADKHKEIQLIEHLDMENLARNLMTLNIIENELTLKRVNLDTGITSVKQFVVEYFDPNEERVPLKDLTEKNDENLKNLTRAYEEKRKVVAGEDRNQQIEQRISGMDEWLKEKLIDLGAIEFQPDLSHIISCNRTINEIEKLLLPQLGKLGVLASDVHEEPIPERMSELFEKLLAGYVDIEKQFKEMKTDLVGWEAALQVKTDLKMFLTWMNEKEPYLIAGFVGEDIKDVTKLIEKHKLFEAECIKKENESGDLVKRFEATEGKIKDENQPMFIEVKKRWMNFISLSQSRKHDLDNGFKLHSIVTECRAMKSNFIDHLTALMSIGEDDHLKAARNSKKILKSIRNDLPSLKIFIDKIQPRLARLNGDLIICPKELYSNYEATHDYKAKSDKEITVTSGSKVALIYPSNSEWWKVSYKGDTDDFVGSRKARIGFLPSAILKHDPDLQKYTGTNVVNKLENSLREINDKLSEKFTIKSDKINELYTSFLVNEKSDEILGWIGDIEKWVRSREVPTMTSRECEGTLSLVTEFEEDCKEKEAMLEDIEDEVLRRVGAKPGADYPKIKYVIDNLKHRFKTLNLLLGRLGDDAKDRRGLLGVVLDYEDFTRCVIPLEKAVKSMKPKPSGVPLAIINQLKDHKIHLTEIGVRADSLRDKSFDDDSIEEIDNPEKYARDAFTSLVASVDKYNHDCLAEKNLKEYNKRAEENNTTIYLMIEDLDCVQIPQILEVDDVDEEPDLEVAKEDIERVQCAKALFEDDLQEFVLDGISLITDNHPKTEDIKDSCEGVQENYEDLNRRLKEMLQDLANARHLFSKKAAPSEINVHIQYFNDTLANPLVDAMGKDERALKRSSMLLERGADALRKIKNAAEGLDPSKKDNVMKRLQDYYTAYQGKQDEVNDAMVEKEFIEQINAFIAWLEELEAVTIASVEDTKDYKEVLKSLEFNLDQRKSEKDAILQMGDDIQKALSQDPELVKALLARFKEVWGDVFAMMDDLGKADAIRKQKQMVKLLTSEMKSWVEATNSKIDGEVLTPETHKIKQAKQLQGSYLADLIKFEGNLDNIDVMISEVSELDFHVGDKLNKVFTIVVEEFKLLKDRLAERQGDITHCDDIYKLLNDIDIQKALIDEMLIKMEMKFKPKTYNKTLIKIKKLSGISKKVDLKTPMLESFFNSEELDNEFVSKAVTELKTEWDDLNNKISEAGRTLEGYEDYYKWQDSSDMFLSRLDIINTELEMTIEPKHFSSLTSKEGKLKLVFAVIDKLGEEFNELQSNGLKIALPKSLFEEETKDTIKLLSTRFNQTKLMLNANYELITDLTKRIKLINSVEVFIGYDTERRRKLDDLDSCCNLAYASVRLAQFHLLEKSINASSQILQEIINNAEELKKSTSKAKEILPFDKELGNAMNIHKELLTQSGITKRKIMANIDMFDNTLDKLFKDFSMRASKLDQWMEDVNEYMTDGVYTHTLQEAKALREYHNQKQNELVDHRKDFREINNIDSQCKKIGLYTNPYTWITIQYLEENWKEVQTQIKEHEYTIGGEIKRQELLDRKKQGFAEKANKFHTTIVQMRKDCAELDTTDPEEALTYLERKMYEIDRLNKIAEELEESVEQDNSAVLIMNSYTKHTMTSLQQELQQLHQLNTNMIHGCENQLDILGMSGVSSDEMKDIYSSFRRFDKDRSDRLDHKEFKDCLRSLGHDLCSAFDAEIEGKDKKFEAILDIVDLDRNGVVGIEEYIQFMIHSRKDTVKTEGEMNAAFKALTDGGDKVDIVPGELEKGLPEQVASYCIANMPAFCGGRTGALDYTTYTRSVIC